ncbi:MAG: two-component sensor histidine kinase [Rudanella sp.]|nr:two-component sensor histidine kinase [Rudanella sp.]
MNSIIDFFARLFDTSNWPPRWHCGTWTDFHGWLYIVSDLMIWGAYMSIPLILIRFVAVKKGVPLLSVFYLFGAFILLCGLTHLLDAIMFWWPAYRLSALIRFLTGVVSIFTVLALIRYFNEAIGLKTSQEFSVEMSFRQQALQELTRSNEELQQFAYVASHDLQSPLNTIENYLSLLEHQHAQEITPDARQLIGVSRAAAGRMRTLINDLLEFSRVGNDTEWSQVNLNDVLAEIIDEQQAEIRQTGASVKLVPLPTLLGHPTDMKQLFQNLLSNGLKYSQTGVSPVIKIWGEDQGTKYLLAVSDNGIGIEKQHFDKIFQLFQRLHSRNQYPGTGIGLATCKKIIDLYGGEIWLDSTVGTGSTFYLTIPKQIKTVKQFVQASS